MSGDGGRQALGMQRYLTSLLAGGAIIKSEMIILPRGASDSMRYDAEYVCAKDNRFDWKYEEDSR